MIAPPPAEIATSLVPVENADARASAPKAKIQIWIRKSDRFHELVSVVGSTRKQSQAPQSESSVAPPDAEQAANASPSMPSDNAEQPSPADS